MKKEVCCSAIVSRHGLKLKRLGIETYQEPIIYMRHDCHICKAEGFETQTRLKVYFNGRQIIATLNVITSDILAFDQVGVSESAWRLLGAKENDWLEFDHLAPIESLSHVRAKVYGHRLDQMALSAIIKDVVAGQYSDLHLATFITACSGDRLDLAETAALTQAMVDAGERLSWPYGQILDKHSVGGLPGNRTTPIVVAIVTACGIIMPKTSSRAITSPAGTADAMETLAPVNLDATAMRAVVEKVGGCVVWGGAVSLSPADDILIRVERPLDLDSEGQLVASILSKKIAAGSSHVLIDMPVGPTAKVRSQAAAQILRQRLMDVGDKLGMRVNVLMTDGSQPIGRGIGPALEATDILQVLQQDANMPQDLAERAILLAGATLELAGAAQPGQGNDMAHHVLTTGRAWRQFQAICEAQGGMREPPRAQYQRTVLATESGRVANIDNRLIARIAKLAGAPIDKAAGLVLYTPVGTHVNKGDPLFTLHAESMGEINYALDYADSHPSVITLEALS